MVISFAHLSPILSILFGVLILVFPRLLNYLVAIYLILAGLLGIGVLGRSTRADAQPSYHPPAAASTVCPPAVNADASAGRSAPVSRARGRVTRTAGHTAS